MREVLLGVAPIVPGEGPTLGRLARDDGEDGYLIENVQAMRPFLVGLVSASDPFLFLSSNGGIAAGRGSPAASLFPYVTEDRLLTEPGITGPVTSILAARAGPSRLWQPLRDAIPPVHHRTRRLFKNSTGTRLTFEEIDEDLQLSFRSSWSSSDRFGLVRTCSVHNLGATPVRIALLDGLLDLVPGDADERVLLAFGSLLDAYRQCERLGDSRLAVYTLASQVVDRPEPREALHATTVWSAGLPGAILRLTGEDRERFDRGAWLAEQRRARGVKGAYLLQVELELAPGEERRWMLVADVMRTQAQVAELLQLLDPESLAGEVLADVRRGTARVQAIVAATDGPQLTADLEVCQHHATNVLFNDMRGGVPAYGMGIPGRDLAAWVRATSVSVAGRHEALLDSLPEGEPLASHRARIASAGDPELTRVCEGYLPLTFGRRHGDPSRPWNRFHIRVRDAAGEPVLDWQGNWRDIFQNWEALARSYPGWVERMIGVFLNASTADGYNPYRIGRGGVDWEVPEPENPWSTIGYWGDHPIVYLTRLLELSMRHHPGVLGALLGSRTFTYAEVPYVIAPHEAMLRDPRSTIRFDAGRHRRILERAARSGSEGRLLQDERGPVLVTLLEKLLVPVLAKLAAFVPGGGVWMNTQRPEWNDANNALAGYGLSMVTAFHLERHLRVLAELVGSEDHVVEVSREVGRWLEETLQVLVASRGAEQDGRSRRAFVDEVAGAATRYREALYTSGLSAPEPLRLSRVHELLAVAGELLRDTLRAARRPDGLVHAYAILEIGAETMEVRPLEEMLEGQVAALGSPAVDDGAACALLDALVASRLHRADLDTYLLYPDRQLPGFLEKNVIREDAMERAPALAGLLERGQVVLRDAAGVLRFHAELSNAAACEAALRAAGASEAAIAQVLEVYESVFHHRAFTGRSGSMFAYEGLGSVYWHMVGKLVLALQERLLASDAPPEIRARLGAHLERLRTGMGGTRRSPSQWGAFPLDPYSHSPGGGGARQPGMTGQVKEEILIRLGELGVLVEGGAVHFRPVLLRREELLAQAAFLDVIHVDGARERVELPAGSLAFTLCQVPVVYRAGEPRVVTTLATGERVDSAGASPGVKLSQELFARSGRVRRIEVGIG